MEEIGPKEIMKEGMKWVSALGVYKSLQKNAGLLMEIIDRIPSVISVANQITDGILLVISVKNKLVAEFCQ